MGKKKVNAYELFMKERQAHEKRVNRKDYSLAQLQSMCDDEWKAKTPEEKESYKARAKAITNGERDPALAPLPRAQAPPAAPPAAAADEDDEPMEGEFAERGLCQIVVEDTPEAELLTKPFYFISTNVMLPKLPLEIGIVKFSLKEGIIETLHRFLDAGPVPQGEMANVKNHCLGNETHRQKGHDIPYQSLPGSVGNNPLSRKEDYSAFFDTLLDFLEDSKNNPEDPNSPYVLYSVGVPDQNFMLQSKESLEYIDSQTANRRGFVKNNFKVENLIDLLYELQTFKSTNEVVEALCRDTLLSSNYDHSPNTNCEFHDQKENNRCAIGTPMRWAYNMSDLLLPLYEVIPTPSHLPQRSSEPNYTALDVQLAPTRTQRRYFESNVASYANAASAPVNGTSASATSAVGEPQTDFRVTERRQEHEQAIRPVAMSEPGPSVAVQPPSRDPRHASNRRGSAPVGNTLPGPGNNSSQRATGFGRGRGIK